MSGIESPVAQLDGFLSGQNGGGFDSQPLGQQNAVARLESARSDQVFAPDFTQHLPDDDRPVQIRW